MNDPDWIEVDSPEWRRMVRKHAKYTILPKHRLFRLQLRLRHGWLRSPPKPKG